MQNRTPRLTMLATAVFGLLMAGQAAGSGFQVRENSTQNAGRSNTGTTVATNAATAMNNPAAMVNLDRSTAELSVALIDLNGGFTGSGVTALGTPLTGVAGGDPGKLTPVPAIAAVFPMKGSLEGLVLGFGVNAPFGLKTEYAKGWLGRYQTTVSDVKTIDLTGSVAFQFSKDFSIGAGVIYQRAEVTLGRDIPLGVILAGATKNAALAATPDGNITVSGKDNAFGFIFGAQWSPVENFKLGYAHRTEIKHKIAGTADFTTPAAFQGFQAGAQTQAAQLAMLPANDPRRAALPQLMALGNGFVDTGATAMMTTPATNTFSAEWKVTPRVAVYGEFQQTKWSSFKDVTINFANPYQQQSVEPFNWSDSFYAGIGADFKINDAFTVRAGLAKDETPTNDKDRTPRLPDNNRTLYSVGASWNPTSNITVDAAYTRIKIDASPINLGLDPAAGRYNTLKGEYRGHANIFGIGASMKF